MIAPPPANVLLPFQQKDLLQIRPQLIDPNQPIQPQVQQQDDPLPIGEQPMDHLIEDQAQLHPNIQVLPNDPRLIGEQPMDRIHLDDNIISQNENNNESIFEDEASEHNVDDDDDEAASSQAYNKSTINASIQDCD